MKATWGHPKVEVPERWNGCLLVNPLCPDDLCWLPAVNGRQHREHCLGTDPWDYRFTISGTAFYMSKTSTTQGELIHEGWIKQIQSSPQEAEFRRQTNPELYYEAFPNEPKPRWLGQLHPTTPEPPYDARTDRPRAAHTWKNSLMSRSKYHRNPTYPCWCGESMVPRYRMMVDCCANYLLRNAPALYLDLDVSTSPLPPPNHEFFRTLRRADGHDIGGEYAFYTAMDDNDWDGAEADAFDLDEQQEYWLETWVLVRRQSRMLGSEPLEDEDDDDDEPGGDQGPV
jgi:hypothetical protein